MARQLSLATYNVHRFLGRDGRSDPARVAAVVAELGADVLALQEVLFPPESGGDLLPSLGDYRLVAAPTCRRGGRAFGNALLTRLDVLDVQELDLSVPPYEPRCALVVELDAPGGTLRVVAAHLGLLPRERRRQFARLCVHLARLDDGPMVVLGDFNEWRSETPALRALERLLGSETSRAPTFPTPHALLALDRIWVRPAARLRSLAVHRSPLASLASDHFPVVARIAVP